jgi:hypothetical protein
MENPWSKKKPNLSKQPGQKGTDLGKFGNSRRDFLKMAGAAVVGMGALKGEALLEEWWASENIESYKGIKIHKFVNEKPTKNI